MENQNLNYLSGTEGSQIASAAAFAVNSGAPSATPSNHGALGDAHCCSEMLRYDDASQMLLAFPALNSSQRWARSAVVRRSDENISDGDLGAVVSGSVRPSLSHDVDELSLLVDVPELAESGEASLRAGEGSAMMANTTQERMRRRQHNLSMDGVVSVRPGMVVTGNEQPRRSVVKKFMSAQELEELALTDPQRARRIRTNREYAAKSKEKKKRYMEELETKLQVLKVHASTLSAQFTMFESDAEGLSMKNKELKLQLQFMEEQVHLHDALNNALLREEVQRLKIMTGQLPAAETFPNAGEMISFVAFSGG